MTRSKIYVIIVNGKPLSGKTTAQNFVKSNMTNHDVIIQSSMATIYDVYRQLGWNGVKDDAFRRDMSVLKQIYIRNCNGPMMELVSLVIRESYRSETAKPLIIFYDCRENDEIDSIIDQINSLHIRDLYCKAIYVQRDDVADTIHGNKSDDDAKFNHDLYDYILYNNQSLDEFYENAQSMIRHIINKEI